jgi:hypothetical protein
MAKAAMNVSLTEALQAFVEGEILGGCKTRDAYRDQPSITAHRRTASFSPSASRSR